MPLPNYWNWLECFEDNLPTLTESFLGDFSQQKLNDFDTIIMCLHKNLEVCNHIPCGIAEIFMHHFDSQAKILSLSAGQSYFGQGSAQACRCPWLAFLSLGWIACHSRGGGTRFKNCHVL